MIEEWSRVIDGAHTPEIDISARRLVSAIGHRLDRADALIDAVMVWENLVGADTEIKFRVTAALAKVIEPEPNKRVQLRKSLGKVYDLRSRIVHGASSDQAKVTEAAKTAISISIKTLRNFYKRGSGWLSLESTDRADSILLGEA